MVSKTIIHKAKSFLCWDIFSDLSVQLIEIQETVSYFLPPSRQSTIIIYHKKGTIDLTLPLFHLFHEAGHLIQFNEMDSKQGSKTFWDYVNTPTGKEKIQFEKLGWQKGHTLLKKFIKTEKLDPDILEQYDVYATKSIETYR
ncbi:MAG: hypothetical protein R6V04_00705 [bacterium]